jgi:hypothetical protein
MKPKFTVNDLRLIAQMAKATDTDQGRRLHEKETAMLRSSANCELMAATIGQGIHSSN